MALKPPRESFHALTVNSTGRLLQDLKSVCHVCAAFDPATTPANQRPTLPSFTAIWDTGATGTVVTQAVVDKCGLQAFTVTNMVGAYGGVSLRNVYLVNLALPNGVGIQNVVVTHGEMQGMDVLIGMNIITLGDFAVTNKGGETVFSFRIPSLHTIDYVEMANQQTQADQRRARPANAVNPAVRKARGRK